VQLPTGATMAALEAHFAAKQTEEDDDDVRLYKWAKACDHMRQLQEQQEKDARKKLRDDAEAAKEACELAIRAAARKDAADAKAASDAALRAAKARAARARAVQAARAKEERDRKDAEDAAANGAVGMLYAHDENAPPEAEAIEVTVPDDAAAGEILCIDYYGAVYGFRVSTPGRVFLKPPGGAPPPSALRPTQLTITPPAGAKPGDVVSIEYRGSRYEVTLAPDYVAGADVAVTVAPPERTPEA